MNELKNRGVEDILIAAVDGPKGFPDAINAVFPQTTVQTCIVHLLRNALEFAYRKDRKDLARAMKLIYSAVDDADIVRGKLLGTEIPGYRSDVAVRLAGSHSLPCLSQGRPAILYTTNAIEGLNSKLCRAVARKGPFPLR